MIASSKVTPAEVGEQLLKSEDPEVALRGLVKFLELNKEERESKEKSCGEIEGDDVADEIEEGVAKLKGLREVMEMAKESSDEMNENGNGKIVRKDEATRGLRILFRFLQQEIKNDSDSNVRENGIH